VKDMENVTNVRITITKEMKKHIAENKKIKYKINKMEKINYLKYRWFYTSSNKLVLAGKNAKQNEELVQQAKAHDLIFHTKTPGSPFCIIKNPTQKDTKETAIFCASFSQGWKKKKKEMEINVFRGNQTLKETKQKIGTFTVIGKVKKIKAKLKLNLIIQKDKIRAVPQIPQSTKSLIKSLFSLEPGNISKEKTAEKIKKIFKDKFNKEEILQAIPAGGFKIKEIKRK
jgi:hypothetical protein